MNITVMSRSEVEDPKIIENLEVDHIIISITDDTKPEARIPNNSKTRDILRLNFDDVSRSEVENHPNLGLKMMTEDDARAILDFVNNNNVNNIIVHCEAGISRSSGVASALWQIYNGNPNEIEDDPRFHPNIDCKNLVISTALKIHGRIWD